MAFLQFYVFLLLYTLTKGKFMLNSHLKVFSGSSNPELAEEICDYLGILTGKVRIQKFSNDNLKICIEENVRNADVFVCRLRYIQFLSCGRKTGRCLTCEPGRIRVRA